MTRTTKVQQAEQDAALDTLRRLLPAGATVTTLISHVSASGMSRTIVPIIVTDGAPFDLSWRIAAAGLFKRARTGAGVTVQGAGMDMAFHLVYSLSQALHGDGYALSFRPL